MSRPYQTLTPLGADPSEGPWTPPLYFWRFLAAVIWVITIIACFIIRRCRRAAPPSRPPPPPSLSLQPLPPQPPLSLPPVHLCFPTAPDMILPHGYGDTSSIEMGTVEPFNISLSEILEADF